ncbi:efflux RND transporter periplasmic adaptor subunit [Paenibacillus qinlingensis]|uniref:RND family efflux transporter MFP subunit n=1 Tax=Paenibacillus qinlingensis TaxID=1837343 RepID=A0ABU1NWW8_9BACL|nr:efflux RND transporter periplasmic adaptor subunit [Paenibacillus qinlingensis]MDR6551965.1 RND family efflux transporter MFP subunit [Paenibacillus qinlingensis]
MDALMAAADGERAKKKGIRKAIVTFVIAMVALTFFSNTLLGISLAEVTTEKALAGTLSHEVTGSGTVESAETADVYVETNWAASEVEVKVGDTVKAGQELVVFKTRETEDSLQDNQARYAQKQLSLEKLQENYQDTFRSNDEKQLRSIARDIESTQLDMQILERQIANQQRQLKEFSRMAAPVSGIVTAVNAVKGAPVPSGKAAVSIADLSKGQQMKATIDDAKAPYVTVGDKTELIFSTLNNARISAQITDIRDAISPSGSNQSSPSTQKGKEITFTLKDDRLKGGETAEFDIVKKTASLRSLLPNDAVREDDQGTYVLLLKEKKGPLGTEYVAQRANVQIGDADDTKTSIENGITPLDKVIVSSSKSISDGDRVRAND